jgi:uncharacterized membrane protein (UPF0127 family)
MTIFTPPTSAPKRSRVFILLVLSLVLLAGSWFLVNRKDDATIVVTFPSGRQIEMEVADTPEKQFFGLAFREGLRPDAGMLYIFEASARHRVGTKGYLVPVDLIWADESRHVVHLVEHAQPCAKDPCPLYGPPPEDARYVLQAGAGLISEEALVAGAELRFALKF